MLVSGGPSAGRDVRLARRGVPFAALSRRDSQSDRALRSRAFLFERPHGPFSAASRFRFFRLAAFTGIAVFSFSLTGGLPHDQALHRYHHNSIGRTRWCLRHRHISSVGYPMTEAGARRRPPAASIVIHQSEHWEHLQKPDRNVVQFFPSSSRRHKNHHGAAPARRNLLINEAALPKTAQSG